ncbi:hypothetical protein FGB62_93g016 [Gracilaria domingensis]|nr:hypothetical protein FGB62_93g016 [Gracilaria domingensis]
MCFPRAPSLPIDVWHNVANHLPPVALANLAATGVQLRHIAVDTLHRKVWRAVFPNVPFDVTQARALTEILSLLCAAPSLRAKRVARQIALLCDMGDDLMDQLLPVSVCFTKSNAARFLHVDACHLSKLPKANVTARSGTRHFPALSLPHVYSLFDTDRKGPLYPLVSILRAALATHSDLHRVVPHVRKASGVGASTGPRTAALLPGRLCASEGLPTRRVGKGLRRVRSAGDSTGAVALVAGTLLPLPAQNGRKRAAQGETTDCKDDAHALVFSGGVCEGAAGQPVVGSEPRESEQDEEGSAGAPTAAACEKTLRAGAARDSCAGSPRARQPRGRAGRAGGGGPAPMFAAAFDGRRVVIGAIPFTFRHLCGVNRSVSRPRARPAARRRGPISPAARRSRRGRESRRAPAPRVLRRWRAIAVSRSAPQHVCRALRAPRSPPVSSSPPALPAPPPSPPTALPLLPPPPPDVMQPPAQQQPDLKLLVHNARLELDAILATLKQVLTFVASGEPSADRTDRSSPTANGPPVQPAVAAENRTLEPVMKRFDSLRTAVANAVSMHAAIVATAQQEEALVTSQQRAALVEQKRSLVEDIRAKNDKIKLLIDQLRDVHRDITVLVSTFFHASPTTRQKK